MSSHDNPNPDPDSPQLPLLPETIEIRLTTKGHIAIVSPEDADLVEYSWNANVSKAGVVYATTQGPNKKRYALHRVILERVLERKLGPLEEVDHIDRDGLNCLRSNLRPATAVQNRANQRVRSNNKSGFTGVTFLSRSKKWRATYRMQKLGDFDTPELAYAAYCEAARKRVGAFFNENKPLLGSR